MAVDKNKELDPNFRLSISSHDPHVSRIHLHPLSTFLINRVCVQRSTFNVQRTDSYCVHASFECHKTAVYGLYGRTGLSIGIAACFEPSTQRASTVPL